MSKIKIAVLGSTGMLGSAVAKHFDGRDDYVVDGSFRDADLATTRRAFYFDPTEMSLDDLPGEYDYIINCIGVIKPFMQDVKNAIYLNSVFPRELAAFHTNVIHITTDCVFSGREGGYDEDSLHDCLDDYGKTKSLGEDPDNCMVIRTSIIGEEIHKFASLISWAKSQAGEKVKGFTNHLWNGITTEEYARVCDQIMKGDLYEKGLFHVFSTTVTKLQMLEAFNDRWDLELDITPVKWKTSCDRTLATKRDLLEKLDVRSFQEMIDSA